jgi:hypothetical protein
MSRHACFSRRDACPAFAQRNMGAAQFPAFVETSRIDNIFVF